MTSAQSIVLRNKKTFPLRPQNYRMNLSEAESARYLLSVRDGCSILGDFHAQLHRKDSGNQALFGMPAHPHLFTRHIELGATRGDWRRW